MNIRILLVLLPMFFYASCDKNNMGDDCYSNSNTQSLTSNNEEREYLLHIPNSYDGSSSVPLMLNFHGFGGSASAYINDADMRTLAESDTFILVYPQGSCMNGVSHWNPSLPGADNKSTADDLSFIEALINEIASSYNIDTERVYACGYSNGGMFAYGLANYKSELIAAVGSVSGTILDFNGPTSHPMPVIHLHGTSDAVIPYNGNNDYNSAQSAIDYWVDFNNTNSNPILTTDSNGGMTIEHYLYAQGDSSVSVELYKYIGGNHVWFNTTFQGKNASQLIWDFVSRYDINGLR
ncbi:MAG: alpha/beta hydrolase-fold protein [Saprospiraceae bacterium]|nr:alpha/beta hydrolase-fold protein [Saprospiraceae bacterium]